MPTRWRRSYGLFVFGHGCWFCAWGMQLVLFSWLVVGELREPAEKVGTAMMALVLPSLLFLLVGGSTADRRDRRWLLGTIHTTAALVVAGLAVAVVTGTFSFPLLIVYALVMGTHQAFAFPARDALLAEVAGPNMMRAVTGATLTQFVAQAAGASTGGGVARLLGTPFALAVQSLVVLVALPAIVAIPRRPRPPRRSEPVRPGEILEGLREVLGSEILRPVFLLSIGIGLFFMGPYTVIFPLLVRDVYHGDVADLGVLQMTFPVGAVVASLWLIRRGFLRRKGRLLVICNSLSALCLVVISTGIPFPAALLSGLVWGISGGVFLNAARTMFQENAPESHRARVLSVYTLGFMGAGTAGSPMAGYLAGQLGALGGCTVSGVAMLLFVASVGLFSKVTKLE